MLSISQRAPDYLFATRRLPTRRIGGRVLIPVSELRKYAKKVVYGMRLALGDCGVLFHLHSGTGEREHDEGNPILVHYGKTPIPEVHECAGRKLCDIGADVRVCLG
jgi:hypothetical protein